jgi:hypothetical protein
MGGKRSAQGGFRSAQEGQVQIVRALFSGVAIAEPPAASLLYGAEAPCPLERACHAFGGQAHARKRERVAGQPITLGTNIERRANTNGMKR